jgi:putative ABC transport system ATP-binding protein
MSGAAMVGERLGVAGPNGALLRDVTLTAQAGRMLAVTGSSGSGKTTLLSVLGGLLVPDTGSVAYDGQPVGTRSGEPRCCSCWRR